MSEEQAKYKTPDLAEQETHGEEETERTQETFRNLREVVGFLRGQGWKVSQSTVYKHQGESKIKPEPDGSYTIKNVLRYARGFLMLKDVKQKVDDEELQRKKTKAEIRRIDEQAKLGRIKRMVEEGKYILRDQFELELAARAAALESALMFMVQAKAGDWIRIVGGNHQRTQDLISDMSDAHNEALNEFASEREFHVLFAITEDMEQGSGVRGQESAKTRAEKTKTALTDPRPPNPDPWVREQGEEEKEENDDQADND